MRSLSLQNQSGAMAEWRGGFWPSRHEKFVKDSGLWWVTGAMTGGYVGFWHSRHRPLSSIDNLKSVGLAYLGLPSLGLSNFHFNLAIGTSFISSTTTLKSRTPHTVRSCNWQQLSFQSPPRSRAPVTTQEMIHKDAMLCLCFARSWRRRAAAADTRRAAAADTRRAAAADTRRAAAADTRLLSRLSIPERSTALKTLGLAIFGAVVDQILFGHQSDAALRKMASSLAESAENLKDIKKSQESIACDIEKIKKSQESMALDYVFFKIRMMLRI